MDFLQKVKKIFSKFFEKNIVDEKNTTIYSSDKDVVDEIHNIWDFLKFRENTQAFHLQAVIGFEEWVTMDEIKRRIKEIFGVEYKNDKSLYPYLKTLSDSGLFETLDIEGKRKWRKKSILIRVRKEIKKEKEKEYQLQKTS